MYVKLCLYVCYMYLVQWTYLLLSSAKIYSSSPGHVKFFLSVFFLSFLLFFLFCPFNFTFFQKQYAGYVQSERHM